jgi:hypothetical protein
MQQLDSPTNLTLNDVKQHFDHWRATRTKQSKIPDSLWSEVKTLNGRYPISQITTALRVNAHQISAGVATKSDFTFVSVRPNLTPLPTVKSVSTDRTSSEATCSFEIHRPCGGIMKITAFPVASMATIINQFVGA